MTRNTHSRPDFPRLVRWASAHRKSAARLAIYPCASMLLAGCVSVPLTHPSRTNLIEHQIDRIDDYSPIPALRGDDDEQSAVVRQVSSRTLISRKEGTVPVRSASFERPAPVPSPRLSAPPPTAGPSARSSKWLRNPLPDKDSDTPDWNAIVQAIGPSTKSVAKRTANLAGRGYSRGRGWVSGAARYAGAKIGPSGGGPVGEYMVTARPGQVGAGGLCWPAIGKVSRGFDPSINHKGIDVCAPTGTPVVAARGGKVVYSGRKLSGFGNVVILDHGAGFASVYAHNSRNLVQDGAWVRQGQQIALVGQTGDASTPHCHFEMRYNTQPIDPRPFLP